MNIPLKRELHRGSVGPDVRAVKRALKKAGHGRFIVVSDTMGRSAVNRLKDFQRAHSIRADGVYGATTHKRLTPYFDAYGRSLMAKAPTTSTSTRRQAIVKAAIYASQRRYEIHYTQGAARMQGVRERIRLPRVPHYEDCSSFCTWLYWLVGAPDPNGLGYSGYGYTGTQIQHGRRISASSIRPGDLVFYGGWTRWSAPTHVAVYVGNGKVVSHGSEAGPLVASMYYRSINRIISYSI
jgi:NlpC/P60 family/Putative peptidoglycan binding domain